MTMKRIFLGLCGVVIVIVGAGIIPITDHFFAIEANDSPDLQHESDIDHNIDSPRLYKEAEENSEAEHIDHESADGLHEGHEDEHGETIVMLTEAERDLAGITIETVAENLLTRDISLAGEIMLNEDTVARIVPRFPGIATKVEKSTGDPVRESDVLAVIESNESLTTYAVRSLIKGTIIGKNITAGEFVSGESTIFTIADLSTVWAHFAVYAKDTAFITRNTHVTIEQIGAQHTTAGVVSYISPICNQETQSFIARVVLPNRDNTWRPGTFIRGIVTVTSEKKTLVVSPEAVQFMDGQHVVFIPDADGDPGYMPVSVIIGERTKHQIEIREGLKPGDPYVSKGSYELKAKLVTSSLSGHAGHGH